MKGRAPNNEGDEKEERQGGTDEGGGDEQHGSKGQKGRDNPNCDQPCTNSKEDRTAMGTREGLDQRKTCRDTDSEGEGRQQQGTTYI